MPLFKDSNNPSCPKKEICSSKTGSKASSNHFQLSGKEDFLWFRSLKPTIVQTSELGGSSEVPSWVKDPAAYTMSMYL